VGQDPPGRQGGSASGARDGLSHLGHRDHGGRDSRGLAHRKAHPRRGGHSHRRGRRVQHGQRPALRLGQGGHPVDTLRRRAPALQYRPRSSPVLFHHGGPPGALFGAAQDGAAVGVRLHGVPAGGDHLHHGAGRQRPAHPPEMGRRPPATTKAKRTALGRDQRTRL